MSINPYFTQGTKNEQYLIEDIIIESLQIYGVNVLYIPRSLVSKDDILGEDRLSQFKNAFEIEMYFENVDSFDGQGSFIQKFGYMMEQSATLVVSRRRWEQLIGRYNVTNLPQRPSEGDLIYFPLTKGLFEIKFVKHQDPFYQLGKLYVYKLQIELFQYSSEKISTGVPEVDMFESLKTFNVDTAVTRYGEIKAINVLTGGSDYTEANVIISSNQGYDGAAEAVITDGVITSIIVTNGGIGYGQFNEPVIITIEGDGIDATASAVIVADIDKPDAFGTNNSFKEEGASFVFNDNNPFGDVM